MGMLTVERWQVMQELFPSARSARASGCRRPRLGDELDSPFERWQPPFLTGYASASGRTPPLERWEAVLRAERSFPYRVVEAGSPQRRAWRGCSACRTTCSHRPRRVCEDRERRAARVGADAAGPSARARTAGANRRSGIDHTDDGRPRPAPLLGGEIDEALAMLADVPFEELQERGWHVQPNNYVWPLNDVPFLRRNPELWAPPRMPREIEWDRRRPARPASPPERLRGRAGRRARGSGASSGRVRMEERRVSAPRTHSRTTGSCADLNPEAGDRDRRGRLDAAPRTERAMQVGVGQDRPRPSRAGSRRRLRSGRTASRAPRR